MRNPPFYKIRDANPVSQHPDGWRRFGVTWLAPTANVEFSCECSLSYHEPSRSMTQPTTTFSRLFDPLASAFRCRDLQGSLWKLLAIHLS